jgi:hypothetical protein
MNQNTNESYHFNFDEASEAWKQNKKSIGNGMYKYICQVVNTNKKVCCKTVYKDSEFCWIHRNKNTHK